MAIAETVILADAEIFELLIPINEAILPIPLATKPIDVFELIQLYEVPLTVPEKLIADVAVPLHND